MASTFPHEDPKAIGKRPTVVPGYGKSSSNDDRGAEVALEVLRGLADQELLRSERIAVRARQAFALAAGFFAVVQTVAFGSFAATNVASSERSTVVDLAIAAGVLLTLCGILVLLADRAFRTRNISSDIVLSIVNDARASGDLAEDRFVEFYATVVDEFRDANEKRHWAVLVTQSAAFLSLLVVLAELVYSLHARVT